MGIHGGAERSSLNLRSNATHTIRTRPFTYFTGEIADGQQVLLGWLSDFLAVIVFDPTGKLLETRKHSLGIDLKKGLGPAVEAKVGAEIRAMQAQLGFRGGPIQVKPFFIEDWQVWIKTFPEDLEDFLTHPDRFSEQDTEILRADIEEWKTAGNCVLKWGNDYHLGQDGRTL
jgi:hypothetical protein